jgi:hypothetical protein
VRVFFTKRFCFLTHCTLLQSLLWFNRIFKNIQCFPSDRADTGMYMQVLLLLLVILPFESHPAWGRSADCMPNPESTSFQLSSAHHGLQTAEDGLPVGSQQLTHLLHLPALTSRKGGCTVAAALPSRYLTTNPGFLYPERSEVPKQAFGFSPVFSLSHCCSSRSVQLWHISHKQL